jgi:hypothetical protein
MPGADDSDGVYTAFRLYVTLQEDKARVGRARKLLDEALSVKEKSADRYDLAFGELSEVQRVELASRISAFLSALMSRSDV